ncbi:MAG: bifunctional adenosylcobinamide kinase/adenosylcobinamide-phosphate guanylyltransferase [Oscillospiraceae bacterium]|nr:bifunctional adenosylcobinamide kinase/adenosylcobinamide-phosphate guanylyltransferase [Oscillospiraceae bacterium]
MLTLITGGSKCGRSALGERLLDGFRGEKYYIATMQPYGAEAGAAIARHRAMRAGKGFTTVEQYTDLGALTLPPGCAVLLECTGNLTANEIFLAGCKAPAEKITQAVAALAATADTLVVIHSEVGADGMTYAPETALYIREMAQLGRNLAQMASTVAECIYGIPIVHKGVLPCF